MKTFLEAIRYSSSCCGCPASNLLSTIHRSRSRWLNFLHFLHFLTFNNRALANIHRSIFLGGFVTGTLFTISFLINNPSLPHLHTITLILRLINVFLGFRFFGELKDLLNLVELDLEVFLQRILLFRAGVRHPLERILLQDLH